MHIHNGGSTANTVLKAADGQNQAEPEARWYRLHNSHACSKRVGFVRGADFGSSRPTFNCTRMLTRKVAFLDNARGADYIRHLCQSSVLARPHDPGCVVQRYLPYAKIIALLSPVMAR
jgi:hypothetical protein